MIGFADLETHAFNNVCKTQSRFGTVARGRWSGIKQMNQTLEKLFPAEIRMDHVGNLKQSALKLVTDSRRVIPGSVFFAIPGLRTDGSFYIEEAIDRGAIAIISEEPIPRLAQIAFIQVKNIRKVVATVARKFYKKPDQSMHMVGITGTNGKTTAGYLTKFLLDSYFGVEKTGLIGTVQYHLGKRTLPSFKTTPEAIDTYAMLQQMTQSGCENCVMEVSSHGIDQQRVYGAGFNVGVFLNLTRDHLDYHKNLENYYQVKRSLFISEKGGAPKTAIINIDDKYGVRLVEDIKGKSDVITFSLQNSDADIYAENISCSSEGSSFDLHWEGGMKKVNIHLPGRYNISNLLASLGVCKSFGISPDQLISHFGEFTQVPGRMERISEGQEYNVFVDYAHTDDALDKALSMLKEITTGKLLLVFGCGGNRDKEKRVTMMQAAQRHADFVCATSDNPRGETVESIFSDMIKGVERPADVEFIADRRAAISRVLDRAEPGDTVLIAGKGHESMQEFKDRIVPFDDRLVTRELLEVKQLVKVKTT